MKKLFIFLFFSYLFLFADVNSILYKIAVENDLSKKTKEENSGIVYIINREDINSLQITYLRDVLNILPVNYRLNRYGIIDPFNPNTNIPFLSSIIKIFIDNQEIVSGFYNSGLAVLNDIDISWVDHIEVYTQAPSLDISTEPSIIVIKLYSKNAKRDEGNNIHLGKGIKDFLFYFEKGKYFKNFSYYSYLSNNNEKSNYNNSKFSKQLLLHIYDDTSSLLGYILFSKRDGLFGFSMDGKVDSSFIKNRYYHLGYNKKFNDFYFYTAVGINKNKSYYYENPILLIYKNTPIKYVDIESFDRVIDVNLKYKKEIKNNIFLFGIKNRFKYFNWQKLNSDKIILPQTSRNNQNVYTMFFQISRLLQKNSMINLGYSFSIFDNDGGIEDQKTKQYRIAHTYLINNFVFKTVFSHIEYTMDPYLINSIFVSRKILKPVKINNIFENIKYNSFIHSYQISFGYLRSKNYFFPDKDGLLSNLKNNLNEKYLGLNYNLRYMPFSKFSFSYYFHYINNVPYYSFYRIHKFVIYNYNQIKKTNFFEELVVTKEENEKFFYDLSLGAKYYKNNNLDFFIRGENLLNRAQKYSYYSIDPLTFQNNPPIKVPFIERRVIAGMEYNF